MQVYGKLGLAISLNLFVRYAKEWWLATTAKYQPDIAQDALTTAQLTKAYARAVKVNVMKAPREYTLSPILIPARPLIRVRFPQIKLFGERFR